jgi:hypothetical protein
MVRALAGDSTITNLPPLRAGVFGLFVVDFFAVDFDALRVAFGFSATPFSVVVSAERAAPPVRVVGIQVPLVI